MEHSWSKLGLGTIKGDASELQIPVIDAGRRDSRCKIWGIRKKLNIYAKT